MHKCQHKISEQTNILTCKFINNEAHSETVAENSELIDHSTNNGQNLKGFYQHIVRQGHATTEEDKLNNLMQKIANLIDDIRK